MLDELKKIWYRKLNLSYFNVEQDLCQKGELARH